MTITHGYVDRLDLSGWINADTGIVNDREGIRLDRAVEAASRLIDDITGRRFYIETDVNDDPVATARTFVATDPYLLQIDDIATTDDLVVKTDPNASGTFTTTWNASDYQLEPLNTIEPWTSLRAVGSQMFPVRYWWGPTYGRAGVQITAVWGWTTPPAAIQQACLILAANLYKRKDQPFAVIGFADAGVLRIRDDPDVQALVAPYARRVIAIA